MEENAVRTTTGGLIRLFARGESVASGAGDESRGIHEYVRRFLLSRRRASTTAVGRRRRPSGVVRRPGRTDVSPRPWEYIPPSRGICVPTGRFAPTRGLERVRDRAFASVTRTYPRVRGDTRGERRRKIVMAPVKTVVRSTTAEQRFSEEENPFSNVAGVFEICPRRVRHVEWGCCCSYNEISRLYYLTDVSVRKIRCITAVDIFHKTTTPSLKIRCFLSI